MWRILGKFHSQSMSVKKIIAFSLAQLCFWLPQVKQDHWWCNLNDVFRIREVFKATIHREHFAVQRAAQQRVLALHRQRGLCDRGVSRHRIWGALAGGLHALHHTLWIFRRPIKRRSLIQVINALSNQREKSRGRDSIYKKNTLTVMFVFVSLQPEQAAWVQRVLRLQEDHHHQPAAILNESNCKYKYKEQPVATNNMSKSNFVFYINNCLTFIAFQAAKQSWTISGRGSRGIHMNLFIKYTN